MKTETAYGTVEVSDGQTVVVVTATGADAYHWSTRAGAHWPCATLPDAEGLMSVTYVCGDLIDMEGVPEDTPADELTAFTDDVIGIAGYAHLSHTADPDNYR